MFENSNIHYEITYIIIKLCAVIGSKILLEEYRYKNNLLMPCIQKHSFKYKIIDF